MNITEFSIIKSRIVISILAVIMVSGIVAYHKLPKNSMPPYTIRVASIVTSFPGAAPMRVESLVTDKIEEVVLELPEIKKVTSVSRAGVSIVNVELKMEVAPNSLQDVWDRLRRKLERLSNLPNGVKPILKDEGIGEVFGIALAITSDGFSYEKMKSVAEDLKNKLIMLDGAAKVVINGIQEQRVLIEYDNAVLQRFGLTIDFLKQQIASTNILLSGGMINVDKHRVILEPSGNFNDLEGLENMLIPVGDGVVYLKDIAKIRREYVSPASQIVSVEGKKALSLHISLKDGANIIKLGNDIDVLISSYSSSLPIGLELDRISSIDHYIEDKVDDFVVNLFQSIVIVFVVMLIFLGLRNGLIIASLIPIVTITTIMIMSFFDLGINQISLAALIMALGMMVDNGIVVAESFMVKTEGGMSITKAAIESCNELLIPLLVSTLTTSAAFSSFYLAESVMGDIMGPIFLVITISLLSSWFMSLSVITFFCIFFYKEKKKSKISILLDYCFDSLRSRYLIVMDMALKNKRSVLIGTCITFILSIIAFTKLSFVFFPDSDRSMITLDLQLPEGVRIEETSRLINEIEEFIDSNLIVGEKNIDGVISYSSFVGKGPSSYDLGYTADEENSNYAHMLINTSSFLINNHIINQLDEFSVSSFPDAEIKVGLLGSGGSGTPIEIKIKGKDPEVLSKISTTIKKKLLSLDGTKNIKDDWGLKSLKYFIATHPEKAIEAKISNQDVAQSLHSSLIGYHSGEFRESENSFQIDLKEYGGNEKEVSELNSVLVFSSQTGKAVPLAQVANIVPMWGYAKIVRENTKRTITVSSELSMDGNAASIMKEISPWLKEQKKFWPKGYDYSIGGEEENSEENMMAVARYIPLSMFIIFLLLVIQFNSLRKTFMVVCTIPLGVIGMVLGLHLFRVPFGFMAFLGVISLAGIVINNAIVLVDRIDFEIEENPTNISSAVIEACLQRFRPILLSTLTTVMGLIPLYLNGGEIWQPMAVTIMIGLLFGTIITLIFIPVIYCVLLKR